MTNLETEDRTRTQPSLLARALQNETPEMVGRIEEIVRLANVSENDPLFLVLAYTGRLQLLMQSGPDALRQTFEGWHEALESSLETYRQTAIKAQAAQIATATAEMVKMERDRESQRLEAIAAKNRWSPGVMLPALALVIGCLAAGFALGRTMQVWQGGGLTEPVQLTQEQASLLLWALSEEGKQAKQLWEWNADSLTTCERDAQAANVAIQTGPQRTATGGFCMLWVVPPENRTFRYGG